MNGARWTDAEKARMAELLREGKTLKEIAKAVDRTVDSVRNQHRKDPDLKAIVIRSKNGFAAGELLGKLLEFHCAHPTATASEIAKAIGCKSSYVRAYASKKGLKIGKSRPWAEKQKSNVIRLDLLPKAKKAGAGCSSSQPAPAPAPLNNIDMVAAWLEKNGGARRFEDGASSSITSIKWFLQDHGYALDVWKNRPRLGKAGAARRVTTWEKVHKLVDKLRIAEGREPFRRQNAGRAA